MTRSVSWFTSVALLTLVTSYAIFTGGADEPFAYSVTIAAIGLLGLIAAAAHLNAARAPQVDRLTDSLAVAFVAYIALQLVPLPIPLLHLLSPTRAEVATSVMALAGGPARAPLTVAPPTTWIQLARITSYAVAFFVSRQLVRRSPYGPWVVVVPLVIIAGAQALYGLSVGPDVEHGALAGSYPNRNHFAGLLEMVLPLALGYAASALNRSGRTGVLALDDVLRAAVPLGLACLMLAAVLFSTSKGGAISCLLSIFFMAALAVGRNMPPARRWRFIGLLTILFVVVFIFLTPPELVERFSAVASNQPTEGRVPIWRDTLRLFAAYPLFGCGLGAFFPAFLRYQFSGIGLAWTNAHNDYLQLLAELGLVGFLVPAGLMLVVFLRSVRAASDVEAGEARFLGLACAGSLLALFIHSLTDFNTYVTANGLVLSWVAGLAATLAPPSLPCAADTGRALRIRTAPLAAIFSVLLLAYGAFSINFLQRHEGDVAAERRYCRFGICDTEGALSALRRQAREQAGGKPTTLAPAVLATYLQRDPSGPYRWDALAASLVTSGQRPVADRVFARALELGPTDAATLLNSAEFEFDSGRRDEAFALTRRALDVRDEQLYDAAFSLLEAKKVKAGDACRALQFERAAAVQYLHRLLQEDTRDLDGARSVWAWAVDRGYVDDAASREYTTAILASGRAKDAWDDWVVYAKRKGVAGYPEQTLVFNGGFEKDSEGGPFDWTIQPRAGVKVTFDKDGPRDGTRSLRLAFDGTENVGDVGVIQRTYLEPGHYRFSVHLRSHKLTTDRGVVFTISFDQSSPQLDLGMMGSRGTTDWTKQTVDFDAPGGVVSMRLARKPSLKFDKLISGQVWLDTVTVEPTLP